MIQSEIYALTAGSLVLPDPECAREIRKQASESYRRRYAMLALEIRRQFGDRSRDKPILANLEILSGVKDAQSAFFWPTTTAVYQRACALYNRGKVEEAGELLGSQVGSTLAYLLYLRGEEFKVTVNCPNGRIDLEAFPYIVPTTERFVTIDSHWVEDVLKGHRPRNVRSYIQGHGIYIDSETPLFLEGLETIAERSPARSDHRALEVDPAISSYFGEALDLLQEVWPEALEEIRVFTRAIVPFWHGYIRSSSIDSHLGCQFLNPTDLQAFEICENLIHENAHNKLDSIMLLDPVLEDSGQLYRSPWREDPRPMQGVFHGVYVFSIVAVYYQKALKHLSGDRAAKARKRLEELGGQLKDGYRTIAEEARLTHFGRNLLEEIGTVIAEVYG